MILKVCGSLICALLNVVSPREDLFDAMFLIRNATLDFIIVPMRKKNYYLTYNDLLMVVFGGMHQGKSQNDMKRNELHSNNEESQSIAVEGARATIRSST